MKRVIFLTFVLFNLSVGFVFPQEPVKVVPLNPLAGDNSIYQISFVSSDTLFRDALITVTFPQQFDLSKVIMANSTNINGGFDVSVEQNRVLLRRTGLGRIISPQESVEIKFANIQNPTDPDTEFSVQVDIQNRSNGQIQRTEPAKVVLKARTTKSEQ